MSRVRALLDALEPFARLGNRDDYPYRPKRLDLPFEWYERARKVWLKYRQAKPSKKQAREIVAFIEAEAVRHHRETVGSAPELTLMDIARRLRKKYRL